MKNVCPHKRCRMTLLLLILLAPLIAAREPYSGVGYRHNAFSTAVENTVNRHDSRTMGAESWFQFNPTPFQFLGAGHGGLRLDRPGTQGEEQE